MTRKERLERAKHALDLAIREEVKKGGGRESGGFFSCQFCGAKLPSEGHEPDCCVEMRKGGGRESGLTVGKTLQRVKSGVAAANSIRTPVYWHRQILGDWHGDWISCVLCHLIEELRAFKARTAK